MGPWCANIRGRLGNAVTWAELSGTSTSARQQPQQQPKIIAHHRRCRCVAVSGAASLRIDMQTIKQWACPFAQQHRSNIEQHFIDKPADKNAPANVAPASNCTSLMPRAASRRSTASRSKRVPCAGVRAQTPRHVAAWHPVRGYTAWVQPLRAHAHAPRWPAPDPAPRAGAARRRCHPPTARSNAGRRRPCRRPSTCTAARTPALRIVARSFTADPFRITGRHRGTAIQTGGQLHRSHGRPRSIRARKAAIELACLRFHQPGFHRDTGRTQRIKTSPIHLPGTGPASLPPHGRRRRR